MSGKSSLKAIAVENITTPEMDGSGLMSIVHLHAVR